MWISSHGYGVHNKTYEHRRVAAETLGRDLLRSEHVHHINGDKLDNRPENLEVLSAKEHRERHDKSLLTDLEIRELFIAGRTVRSICRSGRVSEHRLVPIVSALRRQGFHGWCHNRLHPMYGDNITVYGGKRRCRACVMAYRQKLGYPPDIRATS